MASIDKRRDGQWRARWRAYPGGPQRAQHFARKVDAERFLVDVQHRLLSGTYTPPSAGQITVRAYAAEWMSRRSWAPATHDRIEREIAHPHPPEAHLRACAGRTSRSGRRACRWPPRALAWSTRRLRRCWRLPSTTSASPQPGQGRAAGTDRYPALHPARRRPGPWNRPRGARSHPSRGGAGGRDGPPSR